MDEAGGSEVGNELEVAGGEGAVPVQAAGAPPLHGPACEPALEAAEPRSIERESPENQANLSQRGRPGDSQLARRICL